MKGMGASFGAEGGIVSGGIAESLDRSGNPSSLLVNSAVND